MRYGNLLVKLFIVSLFMASGAFLGSTATSQEDTTDQDCSFCDSASRV